MILFEISNRIEHDDTPRYLLLSQAILQLVKGKFEIFLNYFFDKIPKKFQQRLIVWLGRNRYMKDFYPFKLRSIENSNLGFK